MSDKLNVSIVLPIKSSRARDFAEYFGKAIQSIKNPYQLKTLQIFLRGEKRVNLASKQNRMDNLRKYFANLFSQIKQSQVKKTLNSLAVCWSVKRRVAYID